jgi:NAD(P)-dependent dehydrogenase (short-subunit alcohol dehydrogenase family)
VTAHEVVEASRSSGISVDLAEPDSIRRMFNQVGTVDAVISCTGSVPFKPLAELTDKDFRSGFEDKVLGQVNLAQLGSEYIARRRSWPRLREVGRRHPDRPGLRAGLRHSRTLPSLNAPTQNRAARN